MFKYSVRILYIRTYTHTHTHIFIVVVFFQGVDLLASAGSEFIFYETYESIWRVGRTPWPGDQPEARPLPTQDNTTQKNADTHACFNWDSNPRSQCSSGRSSTCLRPLDNWDQLKYTHTHIWWRGT
jgi:hypothetical protein